MTTSGTLRPTTGTIQHQPPMALSVRRFAALMGLLALGVSAAGSWIPSLWGDEAASIMSAERPLPYLFTMLQHVDAVHGTYYFLLHYWIELFGASPFSVRFPSAIAAGFACAGAVVLANELFSRRVAILSGIVATILPRFTYMGDEARTYALSAAVAVWLTVLLVYLISHRSTKQSLWVLYGVVVAAGIYVFLYLALLVVVHGIYLMLSANGRASRKAWLASVGGAVLLATPVLAFAIGERNQIAFLAETTRASFRLVLAGQWFGTVWFAIAAWALIVLGCLAGTLAPRAGSRIFDTHRGDRGQQVRSFLLISMWCAFPTIVLVVANATILPLYTNRYLSFCAPAAAILVAIGLAAVPWRSLQISAIVALVALAVPSYLAERTEFGKPGGSDWGAVATFVGAHARIGEAIVFDNSVKPSWRPRLAMRVYPEFFTAVDDIALRTPFDQTTGLWDDVYPLQDVTARLVGISHVWSIETTASFEDRANSDLEVLERQGFTVQHIYPIHRTIIYELVRSRS